MTTEAQRINVSVEAIPPPFGSGQTPPVVVPFTTTNLITIAHDLGYNPTSVQVVQVVDGAEQIITDGVVITYDTLNILTVHLDEAISGYVSYQS